MKLFKNLTPKHRIGIINLTFISIAIAAFLIFFSPKVKEINKYKKNINQMKMEFENYGKDIKGFIPDSSDERREWEESKKKIKDKFFIISSKEDILHCVGFLTEQIANIAKKVEVKNLSLILQDPEISLQIDIDPSRYDSSLSVDSIYSAINYQGDLFLQNLKKLNFDLTFKGGLRESAMFLDALLSIHYCLQVNFLEIKRESNSIEEKVNFDIFYLEGKDV